MSEMNELQTKKTTENALLLSAVEKGLDAASIEKIIDVQERIYREQAKQEFFKALSEFQSRCPVIKKNRAIKGKGGTIRSYYASLDDIVSQVKELLKECGLSYDIKSENKDGMVTATCNVHHSGGHTESSFFFSPIDPDAFMNDAQKYASANTYAKRYAFCNAFGIMTGDNDDDGNSLGTGLTANDLYSRFRYLMDSVLENVDTVLGIKSMIESQDLSGAAQLWFELSEQEQRSLWVAYSKGGPFTTQEQRTMKCKEFREAYYGELKKFDEETGEDISKAPNAG